MLQIVIYKKLNFWEEYTPLKSSEAKGKKKMKTDSLFLLPFPCCPVETSSSEWLATNPVPCSELNKFDNRNVLIVIPLY